MVKLYKRDRDLVVNSNKKIRQRNLQISDLLIVSNYKMDTLIIIRDVFSLI